VETLPFNPCYEGDGDDNREEEDKFIAITPTQVTQDGLFRDLVIPVPTEYAAFSNTPILCTHVELVLEGNNPNRFGDDLWMATGLVYRNDELYPELTCP
jgi:hypothetical protein